MNKNLEIAKKLVSLAHMLVAEEITPSVLDGKSKESAKTLVNKVIASPQGIFSDTAWTPVTAIFNRLRDAKINFIMLSNE